MERSGDLQEAYAAYTVEYGPRRAALWFWTQAFSSAPGLVLNFFRWRIIMLANYLKTALRNLIRHRGFALINIVGLALGLAGCLLIFTFIRHETGYDDHHPDLDRIFRVAMHFEHPSLTLDFAKVGPPAAVRLRSDFPQVERAARMMRPSRMLVRREEVSFYETRFFYAEPFLFDILDLAVIAGDPGTALAAPHTLAITRGTAEKYFGRENPLGQTLSIEDKDFEIVALLEDPPSDTHLKCDLLASFKTIEEPDMADSWGWTNFSTYIKLIPGADAEEFGARIEKLEYLYLTPEEIKEEGTNNRYYLQPVRSIHLQSRLAGETERPGSVRTLSVVGAIGLIILLIACINFTNLSTARFTRRAREAGMRKVVGAQRRQLISQFLAESLLTVLLAFFGAMLLARLVLPVFNGMIGRSFAFSDLWRVEAVPVYLALWLATGLAAGAYPALFLAGFRPAVVLKGGPNLGKGRATLRRVLVVGQFSVSIILLIGAFTVRRQLEFIRTADLGFQQEQKLVVPLHGEYSDNVRHQQIKGIFQRLPGVSGTTASLGVPGRNIGAWATALVPGADDQGETSPDDDAFRRMFYYAVDMDFFSEYGLRLSAGRSFRSGDFDNAVLVNSRALKELGLESADAALDRMVMTGYGQRMPIVGVIEDFHYEGLQSEIGPLIITCGTGGHPANQYNMLTLSVNLESLPDTLAAVESEWKRLFPGRPYSFQFVDEIFDGWYRTERGTERMFMVFMLLGLFIAALGLFGLASYTAERRTREIGIRKVLGASAFSITVDLGWEFARWVIAANLIAWPVAWLVMRAWLEDFAYRTTLAPIVFLAAAAAALLVALAAVVWQSVKAARTDPARALRYE